MPPSVPESTARWCRAGCCRRKRRAILGSGSAGLGYIAAAGEFFRAAMIVLGTKIRAGESTPVPCASVLDPTSCHKPGFSEGELQCSGQVKNPEFSPILPRKPSAASRVRLHLLRSRSVADPDRGRRPAEGTAGFARGVRLWQARVARGEDAVRVEVVDPGVQRPQLEAGVVEPDIALAGEALRRVR
jgi:hypothetical protein